MSKINDLNLKSWKEKCLTIFGDRYKIRRTYDINDLGVGIYGFEVYDENNKFLKYFGAVKNINLLEIYVKQYFYKR
jgi:hypothetical protein